MKFQRVFLTMLAALLLPALAFAQTDTRATFTVQKTFSDGNSVTDVTVHIQCFTGLPQNQTQTVQTDNNGEFEVDFVVESYTQGTLDCNVWEDAVDGYDGSYNASSSWSSATDDANGCHFDNVDNSNQVDGSTATCEITNDPAPQMISVTKDWVIDENNNPGDELFPAYKLKLRCDDEIIGGEYSYYSGGYKKTLYDGTTNGVSDTTYTAHVIPDWDGGTSCYVDETVYDSAVEVDNDCGNLEVGIGSGDSCTITNTVFFEGIPTLSQYGMAIMALLMLGVGFVGFRRFV